MLEVTEKAAAELKKFFKEDDGKFVRIYISGAG